MSDESFAAPTFGKPASYSGRKRINVDARPKGYNFDVTVLWLRQAGPGWELVLPSKSTRNDFKHAFSLSRAYPLREAKELASALVVAAGNIDRLEELRGATELPEWAKDVKNGK